MYKIASTAEAAKTIGVSVRKIHRMVAAGELQPLDKLAGLRGAYLFNEAEIQRAKAAREAVAA